MLNLGITHEFGVTNPSASKATWMLGTPMCLPLGTKEKLISCHFFVCEKFPFSNERRNYVGEASCSNQRYYRITILILLEPFLFSL